MTPLVAVIQARMESRRFPGKALADLAGQPLIVHVLQRVQLCRGITDIVAALPETPPNDALAAVLDPLVPVVRGPLDDVASRLLLACDLTRAETLLRVTGDCPLWLPRVAERAIALYAALRRTWPAITYLLDARYPGRDVELFHVPALRARVHDCYHGEDQHVLGCPAALEHVGPLMRDEPSLRLPARAGAPWLAVDTPADLDRVRHHLGAHREELLP
jgi:spore coat polysaccharide biosynthesis protein SpsF